MTLVDATYAGSVDATVFIPTFNGEKYLDRLLTALEFQAFEGNFEILIIDSGSTDKTLAIIAQHPMVRLVQIPSSEFGHGKTRNVAASLARGKYIAFLSHDAIPIGSLWLASLLQPLSDDSGAVAVFGKHLAREGCFPLLKYEIQSVFSACGPDDGITLVGGVGMELDKALPEDLFYSDVNSASTTRFLRDVIPYQDIRYSEDFAFARDILAAGFQKAYQPDAVVEHSNDVTLVEYSKRMFDEILSTGSLSRGRPKMSWPSATVRAFRDAIFCIPKIVADSDYGFTHSLYWLGLNPFFALAKWQGIRRALNVDLTDTERIEQYSLERSRAAAKLDDAVT
jgi:rhamnosyltransferase